MLHRCSLTPKVLDRDEIETVFVSRPSVPEHPHACDPGDVSLLPPIHRLEAAATGCAPPGFHFHEGDHAAATHDQVDVVTPQSEPMGFDRPATRSEKRNGDSLALEPQDLTLVFPLLDRNEPAGSGHGVQ
jgi:hypothetical protein